MIDSTENRATRRSKARRAKNSAVATAAVAAVALGVAGAPSANAIPVDITWNPTYTAGALAGILNAVGNLLPSGTSVAGLYNSGPPQSVNVNLDTSLTVAGITVPASISLSLLLKYIENNNSSQYASTSVLYNTVANIPAPVSCANNTSATACRYALMLGTSEATGNLAEAFRAQIQNVTKGTTPAGFVPFEAAPGSTSAAPTVTAEALALLQNPLRPNGGLYSRFPDLAKALNFDPTMPAAGRYASPDGTIVLNTSTIDATWAYDPMADFPEVFNLAAIANSLSAFLPLNLVTGGLGGFVLTDDTGTPVAIDDVGINIAGLLKMPVPIVGTVPDSLWGGIGKAYYATIVPNSLPLLAPSQLPNLVINTLLKQFNSPYLLGNPFVDAIEPALKILVNIAYPDVVTPSQGGTYNRTFTKSAEEIAFGSVEPLTPEEKAAVPGDVWNALLGGIQAQLAKPFWGILVPNTGAQSAAVTSPVAATASVKAAAATPAVEASPVAAEPVSAPVAPQAAPVADSAPAEAPQAPAAPVVSEPKAPSVPDVDVPEPVQVSAPANDPAPATRAGSHRGRGSSDSGDSSDSGNAGSAGGRHRGAN